VGPSGGIVLRLSVLFGVALAGLAGLGYAYRSDVSGFLAKQGVNLPTASMSGAAAAATPKASAPAVPCRTDPLAPAVTPTVTFSSEPDASGKAARYGTLQYPRGPIQPMQIALTIDDGPDATYHKRVLDILDKHCLKAAFFFVGWYANARPDLVRDTAARGHTIGTHSWNHPNNLRRLSAEAQIHQIGQGFWGSEKALESAPADQQARLAPFFRFPGLNDSPTMLAYLGKRRIAAFSSDFGADDWMGISAAEVERRALKQGASSRGGVVILHETRVHTVEALDSIITEFERRGYRFVQIVPTPGARDAAAAASDPLIGRVRAKR